MKTELTCELSFFMFLAVMILGVAVILVAMLGLVLGCFQ